MLTSNRGYEKFFQNTPLHEEQCFNQHSINCNSNESCSDQLELNKNQQESNFKSNHLVKPSNLVSNDTFTHYKKQQLQCLINSTSNPINSINNINFSSNLNNLVINENPVNLKKKNYFFNHSKNTLKNINVNKQIENKINNKDTSRNKEEDNEVLNINYNSNNLFFNNQFARNHNLNLNLNILNQSNVNKYIYDQIELRFIKQPAKYHRARYMTEGSRGPIRDKSGKSFPLIKLIGYNNKPVKAYCYLSDDKQISQPHLFYQASKLTSRCLTNCNEIKIGNTIALEFELHPRNDMELMIDCLGIVKQRLFEIQQQQQTSNCSFANSSKSLGSLTTSNITNTTANQEKSYLKTPYCRLVFECYIEELNHILKTYSDTIHCKQMMRAPEIHRMSFKECHVSGGKELFIIGKNFTKDIKLLFKYENRWLEQVTPVKELFHQAHLVCKVPKFDSKLVHDLFNDSTSTDKNKFKRISVELYAVCDNKRSSKELFFYYL